MNELPDHVLSYLMGFLCENPNVAGVRRTSKHLREMFDSSITRVVLKEPEIAIDDEEKAELCQFLDRFSHLRDLVVGVHNITLHDVQKCGRFRCLERLLLPSGTVDLAPLASCTALQHLDLSCCRKVFDMAPLASCAATLQHLDLSYCSELKDLTPLAACAALRRLDLSGCFALVDLTPLASCAALRHLDLYGCHYVIDMNPLASCTALQHLGLSGWYTQ
jgi:hypothetical protein